MDILCPEAKAYLLELYTMTGGNLDEQVSMYDVGRILGIEKTDAASMAESLYIQGYAQLKTLSGGIGITREGLEILDIIPPPGPEELLTLGNSSILTSQGRTALESILSEIKKNITDARMPYPLIEEIVMDIKTIEVQIISQKPKIAIIREILKSIRTNFERTDLKEVTAKIQSMITQ